MDEHAGGARTTAEHDARLAEEVDRAGHLVDAGDLAGAVGALADVLTWAEPLYGPGDADVLLVRSELGRTLGALGRHHEAVDVLGPGVVHARDLGEGDADIRAGLIRSLMSALRSSGRGAETPALEWELDQVGGEPDDAEETGEGGGRGHGAGHGSEVGVGPEPGPGVGPDGEPQPVHGAGTTHGAGPGVGPDGEPQPARGAGTTHGAGTGVGPDERDALAADLTDAAGDPGLTAEAAEALVARAEDPAHRQLLPDALALLAGARAAAGDPHGAVEAHARRAQAVAALDGPMSGTALRAGVRHVSALVDAGLLDDALDANMFLGRDARRHRPEDIELADLTTARSADLLAARGRFHEARQVFGELVALRSGTAALGPGHVATLDARHRQAWATLEVAPADALELFEQLAADLARLLPADHPLVDQCANGAAEARRELDHPAP